MNVWNKTITLYNKLTDSDGNVKWYRHILTDCFVKLTSSESHTGPSQRIADCGIIRISEKMNFKMPEEWRKLSDGQRQSYFTISPDDIIVLGNVSEEIDELTAGKRSCELISKYKSSGALTVRSVNINTSLPNSHYFIRGD